MQMHADPIAGALSAEGVVHMSNEALARAQALREQIRGLAPDGALTWGNTFGAFDDMVRAVQDAIAVPQLLSVTHPDPAVRKAAATCEPKVDACVSELYLDDAVAGVLQAFAATKPALTSTQQKLMDEVLREYRRNGLLLDAEKRARLRVLNEQITAKGQEFDITLAETSAKLEVTPEQLRGLPPSFIASHPVQENGKVTLTTDYPDLVPFLRYAEDRNAARDLYVLSENRGHEKNLPLLRELLALRHEKANLLGYATWAEYVVETRMAKTPHAVQEFLRTLHAGLKPRRLEEVEELRAMQRALLPAEGDAIAIYNARFLDDRVRRERFALDTQKLSEYFEASRVLNGVLGIASQLYGISFVRVAMPVWHDDVQVYNLQEHGQTVGRAYLDLYPREGKYKHAAMFSMQEVGEERLPIAALVCNFPQPSNGPALMSHEEVVTLFHEFGHLLHHLLSRSPLASFAGTNVARDFVEVPSQAFEEWAWHRASLDTFARHVETGELLPDALFTAMTNARVFGEAIATERQLFLAVYDFTVHSQEPGVDVEALVQEVYAEYSSFTRVPGTHFPATFGHLVGYSAAYYSYQWALAIAMDVLTRFTQEGMLNAATAADYRATLLAQGACEDEEKLVERFLGRKPSTDAYLRHLGITR